MDNDDDALKAVGKGGRPHRGGRGGGGELELQASVRRESTQKGEEEGKSEVLVGRMAQWRRHFESIGRLHHQKKGIKRILEHVIIQGPPTTCSCGFLTCDFK